MSYILDARYFGSELHEIYSRIEEDNRNRPAVTHPKPLCRKPPKVYFLQGEGFIKIGYSEDPEYRLRQIRSNDGTHYPTGMDYASVAIIRTIPGGRPLERELHAKFSHLRHTGEWFTETPELTEYIESLSERQTA